MMLDKTGQVGCLVAIAFSALALAARAPAQEIVSEDFNSVTGTGGGTVLIGSGYNEISTWDAGITGEWAYAGTWGEGSISSSFANGYVSGGVDGTGAGRLVISGAATVNGGWFAGLFWPDLPLPTLDPTRLSIRADVKGSVVGGPYRLWIDGYNVGAYGLDEDFETVAGEGGGRFCITGNTNCWMPNWDNGIEGEAAFAGVWGGAHITNGVSAWGMPQGGEDGGGGGRIIVDSISYGPGSGWYAGLLWADQVLPSTDLAEVYLTARIKGTARTPDGEFLGDYMLRLEDSDSDWLAFHRTANGDFQTVGGPLSTAVHGGFGDGQFNPDAGPFAVVVVFDNDVTNTWGFGGRLTVDNLFLTGGATREQVGTVSYFGVASGLLADFQSVGGLVSEGFSTFANIDEDFSGGTATGGGTYFDAASACNGWTPGWDDGLEGEAAFAGCWGSVDVVNGAAANVILTGGVGNSRAAELTVTDVNVSGGNCTVGGWWAGLMWDNQVLPDRPLNEIELYAEVKGSVPNGKIHVRVEDGDGDHLAFTGIANGTSFQTIGGPLNLATEGTFPGLGDGDFREDRGPFTVVVAFYEECATWGNGGTLTVDDVYLTPAEFGTGATHFSAVLAFSDEVGTWGSNGTLVVDNLGVVATTSDADSDDDTDLVDFRRLQACFSDEKGGLGKGCQVLDFDGDGDVDNVDYDEFSTNITGP